VKPTNHPYTVSRHRRSSRRSAILLAIALVGLAAAWVALVLQPRSLHPRYSYWGTAATIRYPDGVVEIPDVSTRKQFILRPQFRGIFVVEVFDFARHEPNRSSVHTPTNLPAGTKTTFVNPAYNDGDFGASGPVVEIEVPSWRETRFTGQSRFIGRVWLRREVLWALLTVSAALALIAGTPIALHTHKLRRFKKGLCTRCAYPLPMEQAEPRCPECGTLHFP
jgi:hypothetical protein